MHFNAPCAEKILLHRGVSYRNASNKQTNKLIDVLLHAYYTGKSEVQVSNRCDIHTEIAIIIQIIIQVHISR